MCKLNKFKTPRGIHQVYSKPIRKLRNDQTGDIGKRFRVVKSGRQHFTDLYEKMLLCFDALAFSDVVCDVGGTDDLALAIVNRRYGDRDRQNGPILSSPRRFIEIDPFSLGNALHDPGRFILSIWRKEEGNGLAHGLLGAISIRPLCRSIPTGDDALTRFPNNGDI